MFGAENGSVRARIGVSGSLSMIDLVPRGTMNGLVRVRTIFVRFQMASDGFMRVVGATNQVRSQSPARCAAAAS